MHKLLKFAVLFAILMGAGCVKESKSEYERAAAPVPADGEQLATFAGGCFWCMEATFEPMEGVVEAVSGFAGGEELDPTYKQVSSGRTGHAEVIQIVFNPDTISYEQLLQAFWHNIDPYVEDRQFCDTGRQYRSAIFYHNKEQKQAAEKSKEEIQKLDSERKIYTEISPLEAFYPAETYHQDFYRTNKLRYSLYRRACGRDKKLEKLWGNHRESESGS